MECLVLGGLFLLGVCAIGGPAFIDVLRFCVATLLLLIGLPVLGALLLMAVL